MEIPSDDLLFPRNENDDLYSVTTANDHTISDILTVIHSMSYLIYGITI